MSIFVFQSTHNARIQIRGFRIYFSIKMKNSFHLLATDSDDYDALSKSLENYQAETKQIYRAYYCSIGETHLSCVENDNSYLEANRQVNSPYFIFCSFEFLV